MSEKVARYRCQQCWRHVRRAAYFGVHPRLWCVRCKATQTFQRVPERLWPPPPRRTGETP